MAIEPGQRFTSLFLDAIDAVGTADNMTTDAYLAARAVEHQAELNSNDADFSRFPGRRWRKPAHRTRSKEINDEAAWLDRDMTKRIVFLSHSAIMATRRNNAVLPGA